MARHPLRSTLPVRKIFDHTHTISPDMEVFSGYSRPTSLRWNPRAAHGCAAEPLFMVTDTGTYMDAP